VDKAKALKKIRRYVESHDKAIRRKAEIMVDYFTAQVIGAKKISGRARAMIVCNGIARAIDYFGEVSDTLAEIKSPHKPIVAYSGEPSSSATTPISNAGWRTWRSILPNTPARHRGRALRRDLS
jgi:hypothetical protein